MKSSASTAAFVAALAIGCGGELDDSRIVGSLRALLPSDASRDAQPRDPALEGELPAAASRTRSSTSDREARAVAPSRQGILIEGGEFSSLEDANKKDASDEPFYSFVDAQGVAHMVRGIHNVPTRYRDRARSLSKSSMPVINRYDEAQLRRRPVVPISGSYNPNRMDVVLYSAEWCGACRKAKRLLDREGVEYDLRDIDGDPDAKEEVRRILGSVRIPLLEIGGNYVAGYAPKEIRRLLDERG